ncbi:MULTISPECIES: hypothetical protein [Bradyrhizobium]|nr:MULTISPECIES: hypothetical protein [Bradyrhizobium]
MTLLLPPAEQCGVISRLTLAPGPFDIAFDANEADSDREMVVSG